MDIIAKTQEAHDEFVRSVQTVAHAENLSTALNAFHTQANEVDTYIQGELRTTIKTLEQKKDELKDEVTALELEVQAKQSALAEETLEEYLTVRR